MYIWNTDKLVEDLKNNSVTTRDLKNYYLGSSILMLISYYLAMTYPPQNMTMLLIEAVGSLGITIFGIDFVFKCNGGDNGINFLNKVTAISFPLIVKVFVVGIFIGIIIAAMEDASIEMRTIEWVYTATVILVQMVFFWRLAVHVQRVNAK